MSEQFKGYAKGAFLQEMQFVGPYNRPNIEYNSENSIKISASTTKPAYLVISGRVYPITSDLKCRATVTGIGGLTRGGFELDSSYYVYGVEAEGQVGLVMDTRDPTEGGPFQFPRWTYIGAVSTSDKSAVFKKFKACRGRLIYYDEIFSSNETGAATRKELVISNLPKTARAAYVQLLVFGSSVGSLGAVTSEDVSVDSMIVELYNTSATCYAGPSWVPITTSQTQWLYNQSSSNTSRLEIKGFAEDPSEYP